MERDLDGAHFSLFPNPAYRREDETLSPGGIDLTLQTSRIDEITKCARSGNLRRLLEEVNLQDGLFMTLACDYVTLENGTAGYIAFAFRPDVTAQLKTHTTELDKHFWHYLAQQEQEHDIPTGELVNYAQSVLSWSHAALEIHGQHYEQVRVQYYCQQADEAEWCLDHLRHFLVSCFPCWVAENNA